MTKWLVELRDTITFGDLLTIISMVIAVIAAIISYRKSRTAQKSELQAEVHSKNANEHNLAAQNYYNKMIEMYESQKPKILKEELKEKARFFISVSTPKNTKQVAEHLGIQKEEAFEFVG